MRFLLDLATGPTVRDWGDIAAVLRNVADELDDPASGSLEITGPVQGLIYQDDIGVRDRTLTGDWRIVEGPGRPAAVIHVHAGWILRYTTADGVSVRDVFHTQVIADEAAGAVRTAGSYDRAALTARDGALAEAVDAKQRVMRDDPFESGVAPS